ncbi:MAG TPA: PAS domain-containing protein [Stellaceae bacterium]|nr:PAS domain-containing protein [Stellaceae bacterium]
MLIAAAIAVALAALALSSLGGSGQEAALGALLLLGLVPAVLAQRERARRLALEAENLAGARFRDFAQVASDWLWETDADFRFTYVSENVEENLGYPASYYIGRHRADPLTLGVDPEVAQSLMAEMEARRPFRNHVSQRRHRDGSTYYARTSGKPVFAADGRFLGYRGASLNVTAEVKARREADAAHEQLIEALEIMPAGVMIFDRDDRLVRANARMREMFPNAGPMFEPGTTRAAQLEFALRQGAIPEARERAAEWLSERLEGFRTAPATMLLRFADGRWFQHHGRRLSDGGAITVLIDVTELKRTEQDLRAAKRQSDETLALLDAMQSAAPIGFAYVDLGFRFVRVNGALARATGRSASALIGRTAEEAIPDLWPQIAPALAGVLETGEPLVNVEITGETVAKPRAMRHWLATFYPVRVEDVVAGIGVVAVDVTAQRQVEEQLRQTQKMDAVGQLTGGLAHDFNNLLGVIIGNLDLLLESAKADGEIPELAAEARDAALRGADLTRRLLAFARRQPLQPRQVNVNELIAGASKLLGRLLGESIAILLELDGEVWPVTVDAAQLEAGLANLATNARDAMPAGGSLRIATRNGHLDAAYANEHPSVVPGDYVLIEVTDTGSGMPPEVLRHVFEPFFTTKQPGQGTGLGLSMVFGFMKQSGGHINVYSELGLGTTIRLYLPRAKGGAPSAERHSEEAAPQGQNEMVLVVEDNAALRRMAVRQLGELGYRVDEAENATQAIEMIARDAAIDLLFTDVVMPGGMDGRQLADVVTARWPHIKVLLTSGFPGTMIQRSDPGPGVKLLNKPYRRDQLARALRDALERGDGSGG